VSKIDLREVLAQGGAEQVWPALVEQLVEADVLDGQQVRGADLEQGSLDGRDR
jgi:hypothetical protein